LRKGDLAVVAFIHVVAFILDTAAARQEDHAPALRSPFSSERPMRYVVLRLQFGNHSAIQHFGER